GVENDGQPADGPDIDGNFSHLGQGDVGFGHALEPAERAAAHVDGLEARVLRNLRHDRIERAGSDDEIVALDKFSEIPQEWPPSFSPLKALTLLCAIARNRFVIPGNAGAWR